MPASPPWRSALIGLDAGDIVGGVEAAELGFGRRARLDRLQLLEQSRHLEEIAQPPLGARVLGMLVGLDRQARREDAGVCPGVVPEIELVKDPARRHRRPLFGAAGRAALARVPSGRLSPPGVTLRARPRSGQQASPVRAEGHWHPRTSRRQQARQARPPKTPAHKPRLMNAGNDSRVAIVPDAGSRMRRCIPVQPRCDDASPCLDKLTRRRRSKVVTRVARNHTAASNHSRRRRERPRRNPVRGGLVLRGR